MLLEDTEFIVKRNILRSEFDASGQWGEWRGAGHSGCMISL